MPIHRSVTPSSSGDGQELDQGWRAVLGTSTPHLKCGHTTGKVRKSGVPPSQWSTSSARGDFASPGDFSDVWRCLGLSWLPGGDIGISWVEARMLLNFRTIPTNTEQQCQPGGPDQPRAWRPPPSYWALKPYLPQVPRVSQASTSLSSLYPQKGLLKQFPCCLSLSV